MKKLLSAVTAISLLAACTSKDDPKPEEQKPAETWYLTGVDERFQSDGGEVEDNYSFRIAYNADSSVSKLQVDTLGPDNKSEATSSDYNFQYKNGKLDKVTLRYLDDLVADKFTLVWNAAGQLAEVHEAWVEKRFYGNDGKLVKQEFWTGWGTNSAYVNVTNEYTWKDGNVSTCKYTSASEVLHYEMTYTNRKRSETGASTITDVLYLLGWVSDENFELGTHELAKVTIKDASGKVVRAKAYSYTYNERGHRATMKLDHLRADGSPDFSYSYTYHYEKH